MDTAVVMAKKKTGPAARAPEDQRDSLIAIRCRAEYKEWVSRFAKKLRVNPTNLIDMALAQMAERAGFGEPPER
jgi:hypothetical protein